MNKYEANLAQLKELEVSAYGYELIREVLLPDMLGQDYADMMYWAGKSSPASSRLNPGGSSRFLSGCRLGNAYDRPFKKTGA